MIGHRSKYELSNKACLKTVAKCEGLDGAQHQGSCKKSQYILQKIYFLNTFFDNFNVEIVGSSFHDDSSTIFDDGSCGEKHNDRENESTNGISDLELDWIINDNTSCQDDSNRL